MRVGTASTTSDRSREPVFVLGQGDLSLCFYRIGDRFQHSIAVGASRDICFHSIEGLETDPWPASPPLQELHVQRTSADQEVALLVGMAGNSHWSMSAEMLVPQACLAFDVACRIKQPPARLASTYRASGRSGRISDDHSLEYRTLYGLLTITSDSDCGLATSAGESKSDRGGEEFVLTPTAPVDRIPATIRWRYRFLLRTG